MFDPLDLSRGPGEWDILGNEIHYLQTYPFFFAFLASFETETKWMK